MVSSLLLWFSLAFTLFTSTFVSGLFIEIVDNDGKVYANRRTLVRWSREEDDPSGFDFRFVIDETDVGLARANLVVESPEDSGEVMLTFPRAGVYTVKAVSGPQFTVIGTSNEVEVVFVPTTTISSSTPTAAPSQTTSPSAHPSSTVASENKMRFEAKAGLAAGIVMAIIALFCMIGFVVFVLQRRRKEPKPDRHSFHPEQMVQRRSLGILNITRRLTLLRGGPAASTDPEQGLSVVPSTVATRRTPSASTSTSARTPVPAPLQNPFVTFPGDRNTALRSATRPLPTPPVSGAVVSFAPQIPPKSPRRPPSTPRPLPSTPTPVLPHFQMPSDGAPLSATFLQPAPTPIRALPRLPRTERQERMDLRLEELKILIDAMETESEEYSVVLKDLKNQVQWLEAHVDSEWALGKTDETPPGYAQFMTP